MSWMSQLYQTYEESIQRENQDKNILTPMAHIFANAQIEITLKENGELKDIRKVEKKDKDEVTLIPVTESSAGRSSGVAPHALCDMLPYVAGDFSKYCEKEKDKKTVQKKYEAYIRNLKKWCDSEYSHIKIKAIYQYLSQKQLISDLIKAGIVSIDENNYYKNEKISGQPYEKALVRFQVIDFTKEKTKVWEDTSLIETYIDYYQANQEGRKDICYFSGKEKIISENHPKGIVASSYGAKLVSANDSQGYTYRGRFQNAEQASAFSYEASQKIHSALTGLIKQHGVSVGNTDKRTFVCWNPKGKETVEDIMDPLTGYFDIEEELTEIEYRKRLFKVLAGYKEEFDESDNILVIGLEAATTGRLSITYYNECNAKDFWDKVHEWGKSCEWTYLRFNEQKKPYYKVSTPAFGQIIKCAFGIEQGNFIDVNDKILKEHTQRLLKCMLEGQKMPFDIVNALVNRASMSTAYSKKNREWLLSTACAVIKKYYYDWKGEDYKMQLDLNNTDRSYLFGRLLAVLECAEDRTYSEGERRMTNAIRLQNSFVNHPMQTWLLIEDMLNPYYKKLGPERASYYKKLISDILLKLQEGDAADLNKRLKETYLLGYYLQRAEFYKKREEKQEVEENE